MPRRRTRPRIGKTGCLFWIFILLVIIVIIVYRGKGSLRQTFSTIKNSISRKEVKEEVKKQPAETPLKTKIPEVVEEKGETTSPGAKTVESGQESLEKTKSSTPAVSKEQEKPAVKTEKKSPVVSEKQQKSERKTITTKTLETDIFYVRLNQNDGSVKLVPVTRLVEYKDSPITKTINALLKGPTRSEQNSGIISLIPEGTSLISARLKNGLLTLNFDGRFEENYNGREAILFQLSQVLLTSFSFQQVQGVSIHIDGKKKQYLTGEGIPLKQVYTKQDLSQLNM